jgi:polysaccharide deacetylase 2 family uncharacterized protein YibQ
VIPVSRLRVATFLIFWLILPGVSAAGDLPRISIIIDDMGNHASQGDAALGIPGPVTYAFLPHTPHARRLAEMAHARGKEVMLHLPMESFDGARLGPGGLTLHMTEKSFRRTLDQALQDIPHVRGINNHMGSLLTRHPGAMAWLMEGVSQREGLFFVDSRTTRESVVPEVAFEHGVPNASRDVFLDNRRDPGAIRRQFEELLRQARKKGHAIGIGHPYPETAAVLSDLLADTEALGVELIPVSSMIEVQGSQQLWQASSSHSPRVAKNSKPSPSSTCCEEAELK